ncbi:fibronectin type III domain-containing protein [Niabella ginsengisoli]|uniref:Fibronectin type III domain-containing protein n=1 Tax=Niabella ginsengisoli TaxID=522298 RepID=A0ABS9SI03_9BACT|nr:hypothetical protein [Niabella ginsengisoli]MCH5597965.1 hypothetical protein [Niabella ginsengisoli]
MYSEKLNLTTLNEKIYFAVIALDQRMNQSKRSEFIEVVKPDKVPPSSPVFKNYAVSEDGTIKLQWINSNSEDLAATRIFRRNMNEQQWHLIKEFNDTTIDVLEDKPDSVGSYAYTLLAVDDAGNESQPSHPLAISIRSTGKVQPAKKLTAEADRDKKVILVKWQFDLKDIVEITIYRTVGKDPFTVYQVITPDFDSLEDTEIKVNNIYRYAVRATLKDGRMSEWKEVKVEY